MPSDNKLDLDAIKRNSEEMRAIAKEVDEQRKLLNELRHRLRWQKITRWAEEGLI